MAELLSNLRNKTWSKDNYFISTDSSLIPLKTLNEFFASDDIYWGQPVPEPALAVALQNSLCFGVYKQNLTHTLSSPPPPLPASTTTTNTISEAPSEFIGLARLVTDFTTFAYLTDVYILPTEQGLGLGRWLIGCVRETVDDMPYLRRTLLFTSNWEKSVPYYEELMRMRVIGGRRNDDGRSGVGLAVMGRMGRGHPDFDGEQD